MDMVRGRALWIGLEVAQFGDKGRALDPDKVLFFRIGSSSPPEMDFSTIVLLDELESVLRYDFWHGRKVSVENCSQFLLLVSIEFA